MSADSSTCSTGLFVPFQVRRGAKQVREMNSRNEDRLKIGRRKRKRERTFFSVNYVAIPARKGSKQLNRLRIADIGAYKEKYVLYQFPYELVEFHDVAPW